MTKLRCLHVLLGRKKEKMVINIDNEVGTSTSMTIGLRNHTRGSLRKKIKIGDKEGY